MRTTAFEPFGGYRPFADFDSAFQLMDRLLDRTVPAATPTTMASWPQYDVETLGDDHYRIVLAVPGFEEAELDIVSEPNKLTVRGQPQERQGDGQVVFSGINKAAFTWTYRLADFVKVEGAKLEHGLLKIELVRDVPEALRPRKIAIGGGQAQPAITDQQTN